jgi:hypothetical protein
MVVIAARLGHSDTCMTERHYARRRPMLPRRCDNRSARSASPPRLVLVGPAGNGDTDPASDGIAPAPGGFWHRGGLSG